MAHFHLQFQVITIHTHSDCFHAAWKNLKGILRLMSNLGLNLHNDIILIASLCTLEIMLLVAKFDLLTY